MGIINYNAINLAKVTTFLIKEAEPRVETIVYTYKDVIPEFCKVLLVALVLSVIALIVGICSKLPRKRDLIAFFTISFMVKTVCLTGVFFEKFHPLAKPYSAEKIIRNLLMMLIPSVMCIFVEGLIGMFIIKDKKTSPFIRSAIANMFLILPATYSLFTLLGLFLSSVRLY